MKIPVLIDCDAKFPLMLCKTCGHTIRTKPDLFHTKPGTEDRSNSLPHTPCHALIPVFNSLTSDRSRGGSRGDFNTKSFPLSLLACVTAYQRPLIDVGNPGPCPPNPCRPGRLFCPNQNENYRTGTAQVDIKEAPGFLFPLLRSRSLDINLSLVLTRMLSCSIPFLTTQAVFLASLSH